MRPFCALEYQELLDLEAAGDALHVNRQIQLAELIRLRQFRAAIARLRHKPLLVEQALERMPPPDCTGAWIDAVLEGLRAYQDAQPGAADLLAAAESSR